MIVSHSIGALSAATSPGKRRRCFPIASRPTLDSPPSSVARLQPNTFEPLKTMGKQYNKVIKKKRHIAYLKRKKAATKKTAKPAKK
jgi:hypothetical protein